MNDAIREIYLDRQIDDRLLDELELAGELSPGEFRNFLRRVRALYSDSAENARRADAVAEMMKQIGDKLSRLGDDLTDAAEDIKDRLEAIDNEMDEEE